MPSETTVFAALSFALAAPAMVILATGGSLGAALLAAILCLPISAPITAALFGSAAELLGRNP